jgi:DNA-directed RNA polymerase sigma subunit (sigma70/sigma32)
MRHDVEVSEPYGFSREHVRQVERDALAALRSPEIRARLEGRAHSETRARV